MASSGYTASGYKGKDGVLQVMLSPLAVAKACQDPIGTTGELRCNFSAANGWSTNVLCSVVPMGDGTNGALCRFPKDDPRPPRCDASLPGTPYGFTNCSLSPVNP